MKLKLFSKLATKPGGRKVVRASARAARADEEYYEAEPNMKLSHAFMVVLVLHVVAVGGIWAFNQLNSGKKAADLIPALPGKAALATQQPAAPPEPVVATRQPGDADDPLPTVASHPPAASKPQPRIPGASSIPATAVAASPAAAAAANKASTAKKATATPAASADGTYTVAKGDNPYKIAKKLGVSYQTLLEVNKIEDPTKLQIGAVLKVPTKKN